MSLPARERGLKQYSQIFPNQSSVAPRAGAWIETTVATGLTTVSYVAPRAGAWIETGY